MEQTRHFYPRTAKDGLNTFSFVRFVKIRDQSLPLPSCCLKMGCLRKRGSSLFCVGKLRSFDRITGSSRSLFNGETHPVNPCAFPIKSLLYCFFAVQNLRDWMGDNRQLGRQPWRWCKHMDQRHRPGHQHCSGTGDARDARSGRSMCSCSPQNAPFITSSTM